MQGLPRLRPPEQHQRFPLLCEDLRKQREGLLYPRDGVVVLYERKSQGGVPTRPRLLEIHSARRVDQCRAIVVKMPEVLRSHDAAPALGLLPVAPTRG